MKYTCKINQEIQAELNKSSKRNSIIATIIGIVGLVAYIALSMWKELFVFEMLLWISACLFGVGIAYIVLINKSNKKAANSTMDGEYELEETFMTIKAHKDGEQISSAKVYYKDMVKLKETANYIFLYPNRQMAYPVPKNKLSAEELSLLKSWISEQIAKK